MSVTISSAVRYTWNPKKAAKNLKDHGVSFEEAATVNDDPYALVSLDIDHGQEERLNLIGYSAKSRLLFVVELEVDDTGEVLHIIQARLATNDEREQYESQ